ncbi:MAG: aspartate aminotransferase family protein [Proteobacteria bacterium]|nr:aspartate aminotransferase family protein [Pseudomonadota bacterium]
MSHVMNTYARLPVAFVRGQGVWLYDESGKQYLDALAGIAVNTLGYAHPRLVRALTEQIGRVIHTSNLFQMPLQEQAADRIAEITGLDEVFFCNSGLEANEAAIKVARKYGHDRGVAEPAIIVMEKAFHGRSLATLSATGSRKVQAGFEPLVQGFVRVPLNDLEAVRQVAANNKNVVAVFIEPIQGEGGINVSRLDYLRGLKEICEHNDWLFMSDEVQCGLGRTGKWFVYQHAGIQPDVVPLAKGLASGVPVGACVVGNRAKGVFKPGNHGSTFGGNPLAMCGVVTTLDTVKDEGLLENAVKVGDAIRSGLASALGGLAGVTEIRGMGMMIGVELDRPCGEIVKTALARGLVTNVTADNVIRIVPPLVMSEVEGRQVVERLAPIVREFLQQPADATQPARAAAAR